VRVSLFLSLSLSAKMREKERGEEKDTVRIITSSVAENARCPALLSLPPSLFLSLSHTFGRDVRVSAYKYCVSHEERNKRTIRVRPRKRHGGCCCGVAAAAAGWWGEREEE